MKKFVSWGAAWKSALGIAAICALTGCAGPGYYNGYVGVGPDYGAGWYGPDYYGGYWGGDYYAWGHHRWGRLDHDYAARISAHHAAFGGEPHFASHAAFAGGGFRRR